MMAEVGEMDHSPTRAGQSNPWTTDSPDSPPSPRTDMKVLRKAESVIPENQEPSALMQACLSGVSFLEGLDTPLLGSTSKALQRDPPLDLGMKLSDIGYMILAQAVCTNLAAPFWGILADRGIVGRRRILTFAAIGQGLVTVILAFATDLRTMLFLRCLNGILLAALRPISNGIVADTTGELRRGRIFGRVQATLLVGMFITAMTVVPIAEKTVTLSAPGLSMVFNGWRVATVIVGLLSMAVAGMLLTVMPEPPAHADGDGETTCRAVAHEVRSVLQFFTMPTFCVMIMQGIFGTIPWTVMWSMTLFFQLTGIEDAKASLLGSLSGIVGAFGNVIGGLVADFLTKRLKLHGRPLNAQLTVAFGIPIIYLTFRGIPPGEGSFGVYLVLQIAFGLLGTWAQSGTNFPILSSIVPADARSRVMAWEGAFENSIAFAVGPLAVTLLAERTFGYKFGSQTDASYNLEAADALSKALATTICIPWIVCFFAYSLLHWSYPRDVRRLEAKKAAAAAERAAPGEQVTGPQASTTE